MEPVERSNIARCAAGEGLFGLGMGLASFLTVLPVLLEDYLGAGDVEVGLAFSLASAGWLLAQPLGLVLFGRKRRSKRFLVPWALGFAVPPYLLIAASVYLLGPEHPRLTAGLVLGLLAVRIVGGGSAIPLWFDWQAMVFRRRIRGLAIGMMAGASALGAGLAALAAGGVRHYLEFPVSFALLFGVATAFFVAGLAFFASVREPDEVRRPHATLKLSDLVERFGQSLGERNFRRYLVGRVLLTLGGGGAAFFAVHFTSASGGGVSEATVFALGAFLTLASAVAGPLLGRLGDRAGHKRGVLLGALAQLGAVGVAWLGRGPLACAAAFALLGIAFSAAWVSHNNMLFETCPHESRVAHITLSSMVLGPVLFLVPLGTGWLVALVGSRPAVIGMTLAPTLLGVAWLALMVREPRDVELSRAPPPAQDAAS